MQYKTLFPKLLKSLLVWNKKCNFAKTYHSLDPVIYMCHQDQRSNLNNSITLDSLNAQGQSSIHFLFPTLSDKLLSYFLQVSLGLSSHNHLSTKVIYPKSYQNSNESGTFSGFGEIGPPLHVV